MLWELRWECLPRVSRSAPVRRPPTAAASSGAGARDVPLASGYQGRMGEMRERMLRGELYVADDAENEAEFGRVQELLAWFNGSAPGACDERDALLRRMLRHVGEGVVVRAPFYCEYGAISIGDGTFVNVDAVMLDVAPISIGAACQIATRVQLLTATHPVDPEPRRLGWEYGEPITIADNVWLGGGVIVCPGVTIGQDTVVGAGAVVTRDLPAGVVAAGVPARVRREIGEEDRVEVPQRST
jgi:maltose O-acetyltransferase